MANAAVRIDLSGNTHDLEAVIRQAEPGAEVRLPAGVFMLSRPLVITQSITLIGAGMDQTRIVCRARELVVRFDSGGPFHARNITFAHEGEEPAHVVTVVSGPFEFRSCRFTGAVPGQSAIEKPVTLNLWGEIEGRVVSCEVEGGSYGIIAGAGCQVTIQANHCSGASAIGISLTGGSGVVRRNRCEKCEYGIGVINASPLLEENVCRENGIGILYTDNAGGTARKNECVENREPGIYAAANASPELIENVCSRNGGSGIVVGDQAAPLLERNVAESNGAQGIGYEGQAGGRAHGNTCRSNQDSGIALKGTAAPDLEDNVCEQNAYQGIVYFEQAAGVARGNFCRANQGAGIVVNQNAAPLIEANRCLENEYQGIYYGDEGAGSALRNLCESNEMAGIKLNGSSRPLLEDNVCQNNKAEGISCSEKTTAVARRNVCTGNQAAGFWADDEATVVLEHNVCNQNEAQGIALRQSGAATARGNACSANLWAGIEVSSEASVVVEDNECAEGRDCGITIWAGSATQVKNNLCRDNPNIGIAVLRDAAPLLLSNRCFGNERGIKFDESSAGNARGNQCEGSKTFGIHVSGKAHPTLQSNICRENKLAGISMSENAAPDLERNRCERNDVGIAWIDSAAGTARGNFCSENFKAGVVAGDNAHPVVEDNYFTKNVGDGVVVYPPAKPRLKNNVDTGNHAPDPRIFTLPGCANGNQAVEKVYVTEVAGSLAPTALLERVAHLLSNVWKVHSQLDPVPDMDEGWQFQATQTYRDQSFSGTVVVTCTAHLASPALRLELLFTEDRVPMWMAQQAQQMVAAALFAVALDLHELTGAMMPWTCVRGNWGQNVQYRSPTGMVYQVARFG